MTIARLVFGSVLAALAAGSAAAAPAVTQDRLALRAGPGPGFALLRTIPEGATVNAGSCRGGWCQVRFRGLSGFVDGQALAFGAGGPSYAYETPPAPDGGYADGGYGSTGYALDNSDTYGDSYYGYYGAGYGEGYGYGYPPPGVAVGPNYGGYGATTIEEPGVATINRPVRIRTVTTQTTRTTARAKAPAPTIAGTTGPTTTGAAPTQRARPAQGEAAGTGRPATTGAAPAKRAKPAQGQSGASRPAAPAKRTAPAQPAPGGGQY